VDFLENDHLYEVTLEYLVIPDHTEVLKFQKLRGVIFGMVQMILSLLNKTLTNL
jgi:hypothetical protein